MTVVKWVAAGYVATLVYRALTEPRQIADSFVNASLRRPASGTATHREGGEPTK